MNMSLRTAALIVITLIVSAGFAQEPYPPEIRDFEVYWENTRVGYFSYSLKPMADGWEMQGESFMAVSAAGRPGKLRFITEWKLDPQMRPKNYVLRILSEEGEKSAVEVAFEGDSAILGASGRERSFGIDRDIPPLETTIPDGWVLLAKKLNPKSDSIFTGRALVPMLGRTADLTVWPGHVESGMDGEIRKYRADLGGIATEFYANTRTRLLSYWSIPGQHISIKYVENLDREAIEKDVKQIDVMDAMKSQSRISSDAGIESPIGLEEVKLEANLNLAEGTKPLTESQNQRFKGALSGQQVSGEFRIRMQDYDGDNAHPFPGGPIEEPLAGSLSPADDIESEDSEIILQAELLAAGCENFWCAARNINRFVADTLELGKRSLSARNALKSPEGDALTHARLCCAILRAAGIPAEIVGGMLLDTGFWIRHHWVRAWMGEKDGWVHLDPSTGEDASFSASHFLLWRGIGGLGSDGENEIEITSYE